MLPGGFSYGDYLRCGAIARFAPVMAPLVDAAKGGLPVLGICNGFQVLCESHLLPGALVRNDSLHFVCRDQRLRIESTSTAWTSDYDAGQEIVVPLKNGEGGYVASEAVLDELEGEGRVVGALPRAQPQRQPARHRRHQQRARQRRGPHAAPRARRGGADRPDDRRSRVLHLDPEGSCRGMTPATPSRRPDTVADALAHPEREQPYDQLGLKPNEYAEIREILGRRPTSGELAMYSVMWSEHCSYKSSKVHLRQFGDKKPETDTLLVGIGENAGVVDIGQGWAVTFKVESHNHPSYVEPYQGAATGIGGIVRDIISMGARPVAVMDPLRFGAADHPDTRRVLPGVVAGIGGYGNCLGLPNIGGEIVFDPCYQGNPLVNALCVGTLRHDDIHLASARGVGNLVVLYGAKTGGDGIGGASILASETFDDGGPTKRPAVQVGDPFMEKLLIECTLEVLHAGLVEGIQDLGAAGISCATSELASNGEGGMHVRLDSVPLRDATLTPEEILMSESQERMAAVVRPDRIDEFLAICRKWDVAADVIGEVTDTGRLVIEWHGEVIVDVPPRTVAHDGPVYDRPYARPGWQDALQSDDPGLLARPVTVAELRDTVLTLVGSPNLASKTWVTAAVRPLRPGQHRARPARGRRRHPGRRGERPRRRALDGLQRSLREARPLRRCPARPRRGLPQRRRHRRRHRSR